MADPNDVQEDPKGQAPVLDRVVELPAADRLRGGQEESDLGEPRSGFGQGDLFIGG
jgi:hypothetical protein